MRSGFLPSPHFSLMLLCVQPTHSSLGGFGGNERVVTLTGEPNPPTPMAFMACMRILSKTNNNKYYHIYICLIWNTSFRTFTTLLNFIHCLLTPSKHIMFLTCRWFLATSRRWCIPIHFQQLLNVFHRGQCCKTKYHFHYLAVLSTLRALNWLLLLLSARQRHLDLKEVSYMKLLH